MYELNMSQKIHIDELQLEEATSNQKVKIYK